MGCEYCRGDRNELAEHFLDDYEDGVTVELVRERGRWEIEAAGHYDGGYCCGVKSVEVNFCPMCGRRLAERGQR